MSAAPRPLRTDAVQNRDRVLKAARELFTRRGVDVPLDEIARHAGVGAGTVHRHFPTKTALIEAVAAAGIDELCVRAKRLEVEAEPLDALRQFVQLMLVEGDDSAALKAALTAQGVDPHHPDRLAQVRQAVRTLLRRAQATGEVPRTLTADDVMALVAGAYRTLQHAGVAARSARGRKLTGVILAGMATQSKRR